MAYKHWLRAWLLLIVSGLAAYLGAGKFAATKTDLEIEGLLEPVEIIKDTWGIAHIYARNQEDLFFAQGFNVASDRLFQLEMWRRQATGTVAELLGPKALQRDLGARLLKYRGDLKEELNFYHPYGERIVSSFVKGINVYIDRVLRRPEILPIEFRLLGIKPGHWTPEVVVSRHNGLFRNAAAEVRLAQMIRTLGPEKARELLDLHPGNPDLKPTPGLDLSLIDDKILGLYEESRAPLRFGPEDIIDPNLRAPVISLRGPAAPAPFWSEPVQSTRMGSNNWAVSGRLTRTGFPFLANDPHRDLQIPSLRYWVHLTAPGWNVIGGGEPALPGVSIGHNDLGAWGLTIFSADQEDLYVYETHPDKPDSYRYSDKWEEMTVISEDIPVKGVGAFKAQLKFTRHGPVIFEDAKNHIAVALRAAWLEPGCAPYLSSLMMDQVQDWPEFQKACFRNRAPSENMLWADRKGNIGWQSTGLVPLRRGWPGLLPVPGTGEYEWDGFLPPSELPSLLNPESGFIATANEDNLPAGYPHQVGFLWAEPFRYLRIAEVLSRGKGMDIADMMSLQQDVLSPAARRLIPLLFDLEPSNPLVQRATEMLRDWDFCLRPESGAAAVYVAWEKALLDNLRNILLAEAACSVIWRPSLHKAIGWLEAPGALFDHDPLAERNRLLVRSLEQAVEFLVNTFGPDPGLWRYGDSRFHHVRLTHPLSDGLREDLRLKLDLGPLPRGGNGRTVNNTSDSNNQDSGATFRIVCDLADWDQSVGTNAPGQSGDPEGSHYSDLLKLWSEGQYFPVYFSRAKIESAAEKILRLLPSNKD